MSHDVETSSGNVYADLGAYDAEQMQLKAQLAMVIGEILQRKGLTQQQAAQCLALAEISATDGLPVHS